MIIHTLEVFISLCFANNFDFFYIKLDYAGISVKLSNLCITIYLSLQGLKIEIGWNIEFFKQTLGIEA